MSIFDGISDAWDRMTQPMFTPEEVKAMNTPQAKKKQEEWSKAYDLALGPSFYKAEAATRSVYGQAGQQAWDSSKNNLITGAFEVLETPYRAFVAEPSTARNLFIRKVFEDPTKYVGNFSALLDEMQNAYKLAQGDRSGREWYQAGKDPVTLGQSMDLAFKGDYGDVAARRDYFDDGRAMYMSGGIDAIATVLFDPLNFLIPDMGALNAASAAAKAGARKATSSAARKMNLQTVAASTAKVPSRTQNALDNLFEAISSAMPDLTEAQVKDIAYLHWDSVVGSVSNGRKKDFIYTGDPEFKSVLTAIAPKFKTARNFKDLDLENVISSSLDGYFFDGERIWGMSGTDAIYRYEPNPEFPSGGFWVKQDALPKSFQVALAKDPLVAGTSSSTVKKIKRKTFLEQAEDQVPTFDKPDSLYNFDEASRKFKDIDPADELFAEVTTSDGKLIKGGMFGTLHVNGKPQVVAIADDGSIYTLHSFDYTRALDEPEYNELLTGQFDTKINSNEIPSGFIPEGATSEIDIDYYYSLLGSIDDDLFDRYGSIGGYNLDDAKKAVELNEGLDVTTVGKTEGSADRLVWKLQPNGIDEELVTGFEFPFFNKFSQVESRVVISKDFKYITEDNNGLPIFKKDGKYFTLNFMNELTPYREVKDKITKEVQHIRYSKDAVAARLASEQERLKTVKNNTGQIFDEGPENIKHSFAFASVPADNGGVKLYLVQVTRKFKDFDSMFPEQIGKATIQYGEPWTLTAKEFDNFSEYMYQRVGAGFKSDSIKSKILIRVNSEKEIENLWSRENLYTVSDSDLGTWGYARPTWRPRALPEELSFRIKAIQTLSKKLDEQTTPEGFEIFMKKIGEYVEAYVADYMKWIDPVGSELRGDKFLNTAYKSTVSFFEDFIDTALDGLNRKFKTNVSVNPTPKGVKPVNPDDVIVYPAQPNEVIVTASAKPGISEDGFTFGITKLSKSTKAAKKNNKRKNEGVVKSDIAYVQDEINKLFDFAEANPDKSFYLDDLFSTDYANYIERITRVRPKPSNVRLSTEKPVAQEAIQADNMIKPEEPTPPVIVHSGGAKGADRQWAIEADALGIETKAHSFENHNIGANWKDAPALETRVVHTVEELKEQTELVNAAGKVLGKSAGTNSEPGKLVHRNAFQVINSDAVLCVTNGLEELPDGTFTVGGRGTPWAAEMAKILKKPLYNYSQKDKTWFQWNYELKQWENLDGLPPKYKSFAGIGTSKSLNEDGKQAIRDYLQQYRGATPGRTASATEVVTRATNKNAVKEAELPKFFDSANWEPFVVKVQDEIEGSAYIGRPGRGKKGLYGNPYVVPKGASDMEIWKIVNEDYRNDLVSVIEGNPIENSKVVSYYKELGIDVTTEEGRQKLIKYLMWLDGKPLACPGREPTEICHARVLIDVVESIREGDLNAYIAKTPKIGSTEVFVFGSNLAGRHGAGAALEAKRNYGAEYGNPEGLQGQSYAIPTKDEKLNSLTPEQIKPYVDKFIQFAKENPSITFNMTDIGLGLAKNKPEDIAALFDEVPDNIVFITPNSKLQKALKDKAALDKFDASLQWEKVLFPEGRKSDDQFKWEPRPAREAKINDSIRQRMIKREAEEQRKKAVQDLKNKNRNRENN